MDNTAPQPTSLSDVEKALSSRFSEPTDPNFWETFREFCVVSMQSREIPATERLRFAKAALGVVSRQRQSQSFGPTRSAADEARIRAYAISEFGAEANDPVRDPKTAANVVLSALGEEIREIDELCERWQGSGIETIRRLRRVKNLVKPLELVIPHLATGSRERVDAEKWFSLWSRLP
jgi:hypothetical protein